MAGELVMYDSIYVADLPAGAPAYLGYAGGRWPTFPELSARFPHAHLVSMAISASEAAMGCDCESGDLTPARVPGWVRAALARGVWRPVVYASASAMGGVLDGLLRAGISRGEVRLLSAHYDAGAHICGPEACGYPGCPPCDGTQWTCTARGTGGALIDQSLLAAGFFPAPEPPAPAPMPVPRKGTPRMIMVQPSQAEVPKGSTWPGVHLLLESGRLVHVGPAQNGISNVAAFQGAGIPAPAIVTWAQWEALVAAAPASAAATLATHHGYLAPGGVAAGPQDTP